MQRWIAISFLGLIALIAGCGMGGNTLPVTGKVTYPDGTPVVGARLTFESTTQPISATGTTDANGVYKMTTYETGDGVIPGEHRVLVVPPPQPTPELEEGKPVIYKPEPPAFDLKYSKFETSGLTYNATKAGTYDITVEKP